MRSSVSQVRKKNKAFILEPKLLCTLQPSGAVVAITVYNNAIRDKICAAIQSPIHAPVAKERTGSSAASPRSTFSTSSAGVAGVQKAAEEVSSSQDTLLSTALRDLSSLMEHAAEMMALADRIQKQGGTNSAEILQLQMGVSSSSNASTAVSVGLTRAQGGKTFASGLAREIADFVLPLLQQQHGAPLPVSHLYCLLNRARGTALLSPADLMVGLEALPVVQAPVELTTWHGVKVVQLCNFSVDPYLRRLQQRHDQSCWSGREVASLLQWPLGMGETLCLSLESQGVMVRDETLSGVKYYWNTYFK